MIPQEIEKEGLYVEKLRLLVHDRKVPNNNRARAAISCLGIAQTHHHAIVHLIQSELVASAFALIRCEVEAYIRGEWLSQCASDSVVNSFINGKEPPKVDCLIASLEMLESFNEGVLSKLKEGMWKSMCAYTHTGGLHVQRWNTVESIEANYKSEEICEVLKFSAIIATLSVIGLARISEDDEMANTAYTLLTENLQP